jgi:hypothetical protein
VTYFRAEIPLPPKELSPNERLHWAAKNRATHAYREACGWAYKKALGDAIMAGRVLRLEAGSTAIDGQRPKKLILDVEYYCTRRSGGYHPKDEDNARASLKAAIDALKDVGVIESDAKDRLTWGAFKLVTTARGVGKRHPGVVVMLTVADGNGTP